MSSTSNDDPVMKHLEQFNPMTDRVIKLAVKGGLPFEEAAKVINQFNLEIHNILVKKIKQIEAKEPPPSLTNTNKAG